MVDTAGDLGSDRLVESPDFSSGYGRGSSRRERLLARRRRWRRAVSITIVVVAVGATIALVSGHVVKQTWTERTATLDAQACHSAGAGERDEFTACDIEVSYSGPTGQAQNAHLTGVESNRIHGQTVGIYVDAAGSGVAIAPETRISTGLLVLLSVLVWLALGLVAWAVYPRRSRPSRDAGTRARTGSRS